MLRLGVLLKKSVENADLCDGTGDLQDFKDDLMKYIVDTALKLAPPHLATPDLGIDSPLMKLTHVAANAMHQHHKVSDFGPRRLAPQLCMTHVNHFTGSKSGSITKQDLVDFLADFIHTLGKKNQLQLAVRFAVYILELMNYFKKGLSLEMAISIW